MEDFKKLTKVAGIITILFCLLFYSVPYYCLIAIILGISLLVISTKSDEELYSNKYTLISIITLCINPVSGIIMLVAIGKLEDYKKGVNSPNSPPNKKVIIKKKKVDPEIKKIDMLLKLGVGMVFVSGILFATTSWNFISDLTKAIALIILGTLFLALSRFSENKLKLFYSTYMYWILAMAFYLLTVVGMLYFGIIGSSLTYAGDFSNLAYAITMFTVAGLSLATYLKFSQNSYLYTSYTAVLLMVVNIMIGLGLPNITIILIITIVSLLINIFVSDKTELSKFSKVVSFAVIAFIFSEYLKSNVTLFLVTIIAIVGNINYIAFKSKQESMKILSLLLSYILIPMSVFKLNSESNILCIILMLLASALTLILKFKIINTSKKYELTNFISYSILYLVTLMLTKSFYPIILSSLYLVIIFILRNKFKNDDSFELARYIEPFAIYMVINYIFDYASSFAQSTLLIFATLLYTFISIISKEEKTKKIYNIASYTGIIFSLISSLTDNDSIPALIIIIPCVYHFTVSLMRNESSKQQGALYILTIYSIYNAVYILDVLNVGNVISAIIFICILALALLLIKEEHIRKITLFVLAIPIFNIAESIDNNIICLLMQSILSLYITFLIVKFFCKKENTKEIVGIIGIIISVLLLFEDLNNLTIAIYIGIIGLVTIVIGYYRKDFKGLFITGIIITILNIIYQLEEFWGQIPIWLYLLIGGLGIILFVTYREVKKINKK